MMQPVPTRREEASRVVLETVSEILPALPAGQLTLDKHLRELGADSVDRVEIVLSIIDRLEIDEPMSSFDSILTIGALIDYLSLRTGQ